MFHIWQSYKGEELQKRGYLRSSTTVFTFPDTLGALFFGSSLVVFCLSARRIARSRTSGTNKFFAFILLQLLLIFGILAHALDVDNIQVNVDARKGYYDQFQWISVSASDRHGQFVPMLHGFIVIFTGWVAAYVLATRAYILVGRPCWLGLIFALVLFPMILSQLIMYCLGVTSAFPAHPIINLIIQVPVSLSVLFHAYKTGCEGKKDVFNILEDVFVESGVLLTAGLIVHLVLPLKGIVMEPTNSMLPHLHNLTTFMILGRLVDGEGASIGGAIKLSDEEVTIMDI